MEAQVHHISPLGQVLRPRNLGKIAFYEHTTHPWRNHPQSQIHSRIIFLYSIRGPFRRGKV